MLKEEHASTTRPSSELPQNKTNTRGSRSSEPSDANVTRAAEELAEPISLFGEPLTDAPMILRTSTRGQKSKGRSSEPLSSVTITKEVLEMLVTKTMPIEETSAKPTRSPSNDISVKAKRLLMADSTTKIITNFTNERV